jgi:hypothetical protein
MKNTHWGFTFAVVSGVFVTSRVAAGAASAADPATKVSLRAPGALGIPFKRADSSELVLGAARQPFPLN